ncbi:MAG TPA: 16S rRNA (guanine(966)-N(2))-methyltransferase RsmD [Thermoleophilaceae bacterium]|jgi:16S rRNA (guanine966-N2)-methyltransferase|nr:16S rRNA (guanine(966)-N(2))-methyltransferase RsmD [Thermoleophilaceae bacterium]
MRVVAGQFGGRRLRRPAGSATRPTADRVREALFSMLGDLSEARVLDLYAGSGALGIEALSRGAESAVFVERDPRATSVIERNLADLGLEQRVVCDDALRFLEHGQGVFDVVFCDPPYDFGPRIAGSLAEQLPPLLADNARIVTESDKRKPLELPFPLLRDRSYGDTRIAIHGR